MSKIMTAREAISRFIKDGDTVLVDGFAPCGGPEEMLLEIENSFLETGHPRDLISFGCSYGNSKGRGLDHLAHEGLVKKVIAGYFALNRNLGQMVMDNKIEGYLYPLGVISQILREQAGHRPGLFTPVGVDTFIDPRVDGCALNEISKDEMVQVFEFDGKEYLHYNSVPCDVCILRGTTADENGNLTYERECGFYNGMAAATATKNNGGVVIIQVERIAEAGSLSPKAVKVPGVLVDAIVVAKPENHLMTWRMPYNAYYSGELRGPRTSNADPVKMSAKKIIGRRALMELEPDTVVNLGVGTPEYVGTVAGEEGISDRFTLTVEDGIIGGVPGHGLSFGSSYNSDAVVDMPYQFDFYDGGGLAATFVGLGQMDPNGNVNVSKLGTRLPGVGGFLDVVQARRAVFCGTFTKGGTKTCRVENGKLVIEGEDPSMIKFVNKLIQRTFSGPAAFKKGQPVMYVTERCVMELTADGPVITEIAPGVDLQKNILDMMEFTPKISPNLREMDPKIFQDELMGVKEKFDNWQK